MKTTLPLFAGVLGLALSAGAAAQSSDWDYDYDDGVRCRDVPVQRQKEVKDENQIAGTAIGAVAGGLLGNQVGGGSGRKIATAAGAIGGGIAGNKIQEHNQNNSYETVYERHCESIR
ncbi:glycine zipper 2TM domain-containing protein [Coralloluteibacterium stylophorae]|uniref:Glycine zipper 2TM domain-containing protein n=1 Tax=Coralloluteibacterium stylophorae TaxID=1776034 RepID=A0A8J8AWV0_9GAMM|nr:glycine zipper 2TM domain-containing protein [Coralloluteibacterium stylophorae]MBS7457976.1 glycine zipper 2TM domain-containing protein [Coralloluteibacterium stylophorae]